MSAVQNGIRKVVQKEAKEALIYVVSNALIQIGNLVVIPPTLTPAIPTMTPTEEALGSINGWVWHDWCQVSGQPIGPGKDTTDCVQEGDHYRANGIKENSEAIIPGAKVKLGAGPCLAIGLAETETLATHLS